MSTILFIFKPQLLIHKPYPFISTPYLLCGHTKQLLSHFPKLAQAVGGGDCRDSSRFPFRACLVTGFPSATVFAVEDGGGKL